MAIAHRIAILATAFGCVFPPAFAAPAPEPTIIDQFKAGCSSELYKANPGLTSFVDAGSADGLRFEKLMDETRHSLVNLQRSMDELNVQREEIIEIRVEATSVADIKEVEASFAATPELSGLPFSYRVVDTLPVASARVGFYAVADTSQALAKVSAACTAG